MYYTPIKRIIIMHKQVAIKSLNYKKNTTLSKP